MATRARICFTDCPEMGVSCTGSLATGLVMTAKGFCSTKSMGVGRRGSILRLLKCVTGYRSTKLGTQSALISQPIKHCATFIRKFYRAVQYLYLRCTCVTCAVRHLHLCVTCTCAVPVLQRVSFACCITPHPAALPRTMRCT